MSSFWRRQHRDAQVPSALRAAADVVEVEAESTRFPLTQLVAAAVEKYLETPIPSVQATGKRKHAAELATARALLKAIDRSPIKVERRRSLAFAVEIEIAIAEAESAMNGAAPDSEFRLQIRKLGTWLSRELADLFPMPKLSGAGRRARP